MISGQSVLITGAAHGIGAETARRLAARGARVSLVGLGDLEAVAADCPGSVSFEADVTDRDALEPPSPARSRRSAGSTVFACAGIASAGFVRTMDPDAFERVLEVNLIGVWRTIRATLPHVIERRGYILPVASMAAILPPVGLAAYGAAKAGVENLSLALPWRRRLGVDVGVAYFPGSTPRGPRRRPSRPRRCEARLDQGPAREELPGERGGRGRRRGIERRSRIVAARAG